MEQSRRAVESYWRSRMIDGATLDEDKVTPVYKLEEICELLRSSPAGIVKEVSEFVLKRLEHKSPVVKQKALRLIKYCIGKSGVEFRRQMQRHSVAVRQLLHYKGQLDPLKGDAPNKAVRETAQEVMNVIFSTEENMASTSEDLSRRIQGFGNTNYELHSDDKKSFLSEVVDLGSATIKHGLNSFAQGNSLKKNETGNYRSPNLRRSLTTERDFTDRYEPVEYHNEPQGSFGTPKNQSGPWNQDSRVNKLESTNGNVNANYTEVKTREERLLETIVTSGGVRLQPSRDAIQVFLSEAAKMDALVLSHALDLKLQSPMWQVRMKAICVLEAILRRKDDEKFLKICSYFYENQAVVLKCSESPQASLREKANKVLSLLGGELTGNGVTASGTTARVETVVPQQSQMPDLIDTTDNNSHGIDDTASNESEKRETNLTSSAPLIDDLFGDGNIGVLADNKPNNDDDPFADVSFLMNEHRDNVDHIFSGLNVDNQQDAKANLMSGDKSVPQLFDIFGSQPEFPKVQGDSIEHVSHLMAGLIINENTSNVNQKTIPSSVHPDTLFTDSKGHSIGKVSNNATKAMSSPQTDGENATSLFLTGSLPYNIPPDLMFSPTYDTYPSQPLNYAAMGSLLAQQQILASMANFQQLGDANMLNPGVPSVTRPNGGYSQPIPDIFQLNFPTQSPTSLMTSSKKEETKAFDFISDHLAAARDPKRVV